MSDSELQYYEIVPGAPLSEYVRCIWRLSAPTGGLGPSPAPIVPDGCVELVLNLADPFIRHTLDAVPYRQPLALVAGQISRAITIAPSGRVDLWGIRFHPWTASTFLGVSGNELRDCIVPLDAVSPSLQRALTSVCETPIPEAQLEALVIALACHGRTARPVDESVGRLVIHTMRDREPRSVKGLAREAGLSTRRVESMFRNVVGLTPKRLLRISRFQRALALKRRHDQLTWSAIAIRAGYYDHAHMLHDSDDIVGCTPATLLSTEAGLTESFLTE